MTYIRFLLVCLFAAVLTLACAPVNADAVYSNERGILRVVDKPCPAAIAIKAPQGMRGNYRFAAAVIKGDRFAACAALATVTGQKGIYVHVIYDDGATDLLPYSEFRDEEPTPAAPTI